MSHFTFIGRSTIS